MWDVPGFRSAGHICVWCSSPCPVMEQTLTGFMEKLKRAGVGTEGQLGKLGAISNALKYYKTQLLKDVTSPEQAKILTAIRG